MTNRFLFTWVLVAGCKYPDPGVQPPAPDAPATAIDAPADARDAPPACTPGKVRWAKPMGTADDETLIARAQFTALGDGDYAIAAHRAAVGGTVGHTYLMKFAPDGTQRWAKSFGGSADDTPFAVAAIANGVVTCGGVGADTTGFQCADSRNCGFCVKTDLAGAVGWQKSYGGTAADVFMFQTARPTASGIFVAGYTTDTDAWIDGMSERIDPTTGAATGEKTYGGDGENAIDDLREVGDGTYLLPGHTNAWRACEQPWIGHVAGDGTLLGQLSMGPCMAEAPGTAHPEKREAAMAAEALPGGNILVAGHEYVEGMKLQAFVAEIEHLDTTPHELWRKTFGGTGDDYFKSITVLADGFLLVGGTSTPTNGADLYIVRTDTAGNEVWHQTAGGAGDEQGYAALRATDGTYLIAGTSTSSGGFGGSDVVITDLEVCD